MKIHIEIGKETSNALNELKKLTGASINWLTNKALKNYIKARLDNRLIKKD